MALDLGKRLEGIRETIARLLGHEHAHVHAAAAEAASQIDALKADIDAAGAHLGAEAHKAAAPLEAEAGHDAAALAETAEHDAAADAKTITAPDPQPETTVEAAGGETQAS